MSTLVDHAACIMRRHLRFLEELQGALELVKPAPAGPRDPRLDAQFLRHLEDDLSREPQLPKNARGVGEDR